LGEGVVDLPGHPLPLIEYPGLAGVDQQLGVQAGVLRQRRFKFEVGFVQLDERLFLLVVAFIGQLGEVEERAGQRDADRADGDPFPPCALDDFGRPTQVRHRRDRRRRGGAGIAPPAVQVQERLGVSDEGEEAEEGSDRHQTGGEHHQSRVVQAHQGAVLVPFRVEGVETEQPEHGRGRKPEHRRGVHRHAPGRLQQSDRSADREQEVWENVEDCDLPALPAVELLAQFGLDAHGIAPLRGPTPPT
jgi:hypothetical protein